MRRRNYCIPLGMSFKYHSNLVDLFWTAVLGKILTSDNLVKINITLVN